MNTLIVYAHPWEGSYNYSIRESTVAHLKRAGHTVDMIDLYKDKFNPVLSEEDLSLYAQGKSADPLVREYQKMMEKAEQLIFIFPIWWYDMPAILKGFVDKVLLKNWAYDTSTMIPRGKISFIKKTVVITTMKSPKFLLWIIYRKVIKSSFIKGTLRFCGLKNIKWYNIANVKAMGQLKREKMLQQLERYI